MYPCTYLGLLMKSRKRLPSGIVIDCHIPCSLTIATQRSGQKSTRAQFACSLHINVLAIPELGYAVLKNLTTSAHVVARARDAVTFKPRRRVAEESKDAQVQSGELVNELHKHDLHVLVGFES